MARRSLWLNFLEAEFSQEIQTKVLELSSLLFTVISTGFPWDFYFFRITQPLTISSVLLLYTVKEKGGIPDRIPHPLPYRWRNPYRNLKSENSQDYAQKPQRNCMFRNSASGKNVGYTLVTQTNDPLIF